MVRIMGNSIERVRISDLRDTIYYRQKKELTDQDFDSSKDLQRELRAGRIIILERVPMVRTDTSDERPSDQNRTILETLSKILRMGGVNAQEVKKVVTEALAEHKSENQSPDIQETLLNCMPLITEAIRQEVSKIQVVSGGSVATIMDERTGAAAYTDAVYTPTVNTDGMISNVTAESRTSDSGDVGDALAALRRLNGMK